MSRASALVVFALVAGCASSPSPAPAPQPVVAAQPAAVVAPRGSLYSRIPAEVGSFKLTQRSAVTGAPTDSLFRFSDGSRILLTVIIYEISADIKVDPDSQKWTFREGEKFRLVQQIRKDRGLHANFTIAFSDSTRFEAGGRRILEHSIASPTRLNTGDITVELQYLYLIDGKMVKVRGTIPGQVAGQVNTGAVPQFARELATRVARGGP